MAKVILDSNENFTVAAGNSADIIGDNTAQTVTLQLGASVEFIGGMAGDTIVIAGNAANYTAVANGATVTLTDSVSGATIVIPAATGAASLQFDDGARDLLIDTSGAAAAVMLGTDTVTDTETQLSGDTNNPTDPTEPTEPTLTLTADVDTVTGTAGDDAFTGSLTVAGSQTLQSFDSIDGGEGTDSLTATLTGGTAAPSLTSVENIFARSVTSANTLDLANAEGYQQLWSNASQQNMTFDSVAEQVTVGAQNIARGATHTVTVNYDAATVAATDTQAIALTDAVLTLDINQNAANLDTVENVSIAATGTNDVTFASAGTDGILDNADIHNLTITGAGDLTIAEGTSNGITAGTVDASSATGDIELTVADTVGTNLATGVTARSVTLGSGDDTLNALGNIAVGSFEGGAGNDTINVDGTSATLVDNLITNVSGFETLGLNGLDQALSAATLSNVGYTSLVVTAATGGAAINNLTDTTAVTLVDANGGSAISLAVTGADTNDADSFAFTLQGDDGSDSNYAVTIADVENLSVTTVDADADVFQTTTLAITSGQLENLTISGDEAVVFDGTGNGALESVDVSGVAVADAGANDLVADITVGDGVTVTGTAGNDSITFGESAAITGGAGEDLFTADLVTTTAADVPRFSTITDLNASEDDSIDFGGVVLSTATGGTDVNVIAEADLGLAPGVNATFAAYLDAASGQAAGTLSSFEFAGNTYLVQDNDASNTFAAAADYIIELTGSVDVTEFTYA